MYPLRFDAALAALLVGVGYVLVGFPAYLVGHRTDRPRLRDGARALVTYAPAPFLAAAVLFFLSLLAGGVPLPALVVVPLAALVPPARAVMAAFDDAD